jgi:cytochrome c oxidase accessory protein FixG
MVEPARSSQTAEHSGDPRSGSLYAKRRKIQTLRARGRFQRLRDSIHAFLVLFFYALPWLEWQGRQAVRLDLPGRKFAFFGLTFWPQDFILLSWLLIIATFALFFFTVFAGRLWCGYACPQTVWTRGFVWIEQLVEGDRNKRIKLDRAARNPEKILRRSAKVLLWTALSLLNAFTAVGYFTPIREFAGKLASLTLGPAESFWFLSVAGLTYLLSTALREQVCIYMCPYARFQSVMFDENTLVISYDAQRGEPRGSRSRRLSAREQGKGSCIDCRLCVHACPTGIDIRDGLQLECIACTACIDVCDGIMEKMGYQLGLIRYCTGNELEGRETRWLSPRLAGYGVALTLMIALFSYQLAHRVPLGLDIIRDRNRLYRESFDGSIENVYTLRILNMDQQDHTFRISSKGEALLTYAGKNQVLVAGGEQLSLPVRLRAEPEDATSTETSSRVSFTVQAIGDPRIAITQESRFIRARLMENQGTGR